MRELSLSRRAQARLARSRHRRGQIVAGMRCVPTLVLLSANAAMAAPTILDFEDLAAGTTITTQYGDRGVVFGSYFLDTDPAAPSGTRVLRTIPLGSEWFDPIPLVMTFGFPQARVKLFATSSGATLDGTLIAFDAFDQEVVRDGPKPVAADVFTTVFEVTDAVAMPRIMRAELRLENGVKFAIDDLEFESARGGCQDPPPRIVEIREADPQRDKQQHDCMRRCLEKAVSIDDTTILLGPNVLLDFTDATDEEIPLGFGRCVTLTSASTFPSDALSCEDILSPKERQIWCRNVELDPAALPSTPPQSRGRRDRAGSATFAGSSVSELAGSAIDVQPARTPQSFGPLLNYGPHRANDTVFLEIGCGAGDPEPSDHVRISGFRIQGPSLGQQENENIGIHIKRCLDIEISNMEIFGWGGQGVQVLDEGDADNQPEEGPGQVPPNNFPGERIGRPDQVRIFRNYIHHNQHPRGVINTHTAGYGVQVHSGAWAQIYENLFDFNRHAIEGSGDMGGYEALRNLVLKGGGYHGVGFQTHQFDIHGTAEGPLCDSHGDVTERCHTGKGGQAGVRTVFAENSFQYLNGAAISIRGRPQGRPDEPRPEDRFGVVIRDSIFAHEGLENDRGDDAIKIFYGVDIGDVIQIGPNNEINFDPYGHYGVCDFDGDAIDDLFLATGRTWWFSSKGEFPWSYLTDRTERLDQVRLGYFDDDQLCDVLTESNGEWLIASGGTGDWESIGTFGETAGEPSPPLSEVVFGRFDPSIRDHRPGATRRTTDAFWRPKEREEWLVRSLSKPDPDPEGWQHAQFSSKPLSALRFGDFTGDGVTDVLAVDNGRWSISESARSGWRGINSLSNDVSSLRIADLNHNNVDDLIRLQRGEDEFCETICVDGEVTTDPPCKNQCRTVTAATWFVSYDGRSSWSRFATHHGSDGSKWTVHGFAGRFGESRRSAVLLIDGRDRIGYFRAPNRPGCVPSLEDSCAVAWTSLFAY